MNELSGPVGIVTMIDDTYNQSAAYGWLDVFLNMLNISILLSANLGVMNTVGFACLMVLMVFILYNDIQKLI